MRDINEVKLLGTVSQPVRVNPTKNGSVANVSIVTSMKRGEYDIKKFHSITCWNELANEAGSLKEGDRLFVSGRIDTDKYEKNGQTVYKDKITANAIARVMGGVEVGSDEAPSRPAGGPPGSFSSGGGRKSTFPYADKAHKVSWPKPDESGFSYADDGVAQLCVAWTDPTSPDKGGAVYQLVDNNWSAHGEVDSVLITDDDIPF
jgi:single-strand DNA-binding protein